MPSSSDLTTAPLRPVIIHYFVLPNIISRYTKYLISVALFYRNMFVVRYEKLHNTKYKHLTHTYVCIDVCMYVYIMYVCMCICTYIYMCVSVYLKLTVILCNFEIILSIYLKPMASTSKAN